TEGVLKMMWLSRLKLVCVTLVLLAVAGSGTGLVALQVTAREQENAGHENVSQQPEKAAPPAQATPRPPKEALRYGGKHFDDCRTLLLTELKPESRAEAIKALGMFGANGYGREAAVAIVEAMRGYAYEAADEADAKVFNAATGGLSRIGAEVVPVLVEEL